MDSYLTAAEYAALHGISPRTVRHYCAIGKMADARLVGKTWYLPAAAPLPLHRPRRRMHPLLRILREQKEAGLRGNLYHRTQIELTYNSNHIEGSRLTAEQTNAIFETNTILPEGGTVNVDDVLETVHHFRCVDTILDRAEEPLTVGLICDLHRMLKRDTADSRRAWFAVGSWKRLPNEVGGIETTPPDEVDIAVRALLKRYNAIHPKTLDDLLDFHVQFERIHPFQDGNGRIGRLLLFKECLANDIIPFIITEELKTFYYRGLPQWPQIPGYLRDTCLSAQNDYKALLQRMGIQ